MAKDIKEEPVEAKIIHEYYHRAGAGRVFFGLLLIGGGVGIILNDFYGIDVWRYFWPAVLIFLGLFIIVRSVNY